MKILIIGGGLIGCERLDALKLISINHSVDFDITVIDKNQESLKLLKDKYNCNVYTKINDLDSSKYEWVFICTPHSDAPEMIYKSFSFFFHRIYHFY